MMISPLVRARILAEARRNDLLDDASRARQLAAASRSGTAFPPHIAKIRVAKRRYGRGRRARLGFGVGFGASADPYPRS
jgi:hypothetical protein